MHGYQLTFFTHQDRRHEGRPLADWLLDEACRMGLAGATLVAAAEGFGAHGRRRSARFFELADQPVELTLVLGADEAERLLDHLKAAGVDVFYVRTPVEYGSTGAR